VGHALSWCLEGGFRAIERFFRARAICLAQLRQISEKHIHILIPTPRVIPLEEKIQAGC